MEIFSNNRERIIIADDAFSKGGEGTVHEVNSAPTRFSNVCVKLYHPVKRTPSLHRKIVYMTQNKPINIRSNGYIIAWPMEVVYDRYGSFVGFVMPKAYANSKKLTYLTTTDISKQLGSDWHNNFERSNRITSMRNRLALSHNIAVAVYQLHATGKYVLEDFKPDNVLITSRGDVTLVDMDSVQISESGIMKFPGTAATPNYMPPEHYREGVGKNKSVPLRTSWDSFAIGVVFYQLLLGLHPYVVNPKFPRSDDSNDISQNVADNLFPFGNNSYKIASYSNLHNSFKILPQSLQILFLRTFSGSASTRPTADEWGRVTLQEYKNAPLPSSTASTQRPYKPSYSSSSSTTSRQIPSKRKSKARRWRISKNTVMGVLVSLIAIAGFVSYMNYHPVSFLNIGDIGSTSQYGESGELSISTDAKSGAVYVYSDDDWIKVESYSTQKANLVIDPNEDTERVGHIYITAYSKLFDYTMSSIRKTYEIHQKSGKSTMLKTDVSSLDFDKYGNALNKSLFTIKCDGVAINVNSNRDWISVQRNSGTMGKNGEYEYSINIGINNGDSRSGQIRVSAPPHEKSVTIRQHKGSATFLSVNKYSVRGMKKEGLDDGHYYGVEITTDGASWTASGPSWVNLTTYTSLLKIVPSANDGKVRTGTVYVHSNNGHTEEITVTQDGNPSDLSAYPSEWRPGTSSTSKSFDIENDSWQDLTVSTDKYWLDASSSSRERVRVSCDSNSDEPRYGTVTVRCGNSTCYITVKQDGYKSCRSCGGNGQTACTNWGAYTNVFLWHVVNNGFGEIYCPTCGGSGRVQCSKCGGKGKAVYSY